MLPESDLVLQLHLRGVIMIKEGTLQRHHMITCLKKGNLLHLLQGNPLEKGDEEGVLRNLVRFLEKRGDGHHRLRWCPQNLQKCHLRNLRSLERKKRRTPRVVGGLKELSLCRIGQHVKRDLDLLEDRNHHEHSDLKLYRLRHQKLTNIHLGMIVN